MLGSGRAALTFIKSNSVLLLVLSIIQLLTIGLITFLLMGGDDQKYFSSVRSAENYSVATKTVASYQAEEHLMSERQRVFAGKLLRLQIRKNVSSDAQARKPIRPCDYSAYSLGLKGRITIDLPLVPPKMEEIEAKYWKVGRGGHYKPDTCQPLHKVAIIIPYRDRVTQLLHFLNYMHGFLMKQRIDYRIYIINQHGNGIFNRAKLMNVGFVEAGTDYEWDCYTFHDVDLLPEDDRILYTCPNSPRHLSRGIDKFKYKLPYSTIFGGACQVNRDHFVMVNGFSNTYWGWGGEDDDFSTRLSAKKLVKIRYSQEVARYKMISHKHEGGNPVNAERWTKLERSAHNMATDGLSSLSFWVVKREEHKLYTNITVELFGPEKPPEVKKKIVEKVKSPRSNVNPSQPRHPTIKLANNQIVHSYEPLKAPNQPNGLPLTGRLQPSLANNLQGKPQIQAKEGENSSATFEKSNDKKPQGSIQFQQEDVTKASFSADLIQTQNSSLEKLQSKSSNSEAQQLFKNTTSFVQESAEAKPVVKSYRTKLPPGFKLAQNIGETIRTKYGVSNISQHTQRLNENT